MNPSPREAGARRRFARSLRRCAALAASACLLAFVAGAAGAAGGDPSFAPGPPIPAGPAPDSAAVADFNADSKPDLAVANSPPASDVRILLENDAGRFSLAPGSPVKAGGYLHSVSSADFNGDGKADLAVASRGSNEITVLLGDGAGGITRAPGSPVAAGGEPASVSAADLNGDGKVDLVASVYQNAWRIAILIGVGSGRFAPAPGSPVAMGGGDSLSFAVADFNADGKPDLAVSNSGANEISLLLGDGAGGFGHPTTILAARFPRALAAHDVNGDGKTDLLAVTAKGTVVLLSNGARGFRAAPGSPIAAWGNELMITDFNGDGKADFAAGVNPDQRRADQVAVVLGDGTGAFRPAAYSPFTAYAALDIAAADFDGDGKRDIFALSGIGAAWWPTPRGTAVLLQTPSTPPVVGSDRPSGSMDPVFSTRAPITALAADGNRVAVTTFKRGLRCARRILVWSAPRRKSSSFQSGDCVNEVAVAGARVAWIKEEDGNNAYLSVIAAKVSGGRPRTIEDGITNGFGAGEDPTGEWVGQLLGAGQLLAHNYWIVGCTHTNPGGDYCDDWGVGQKNLVRVDARRAVVVRRGADTYPLRAVGEGRMAVESGGVVTVLAPSGRRVTTVPAIPKDPPRTIALSASHLAILRTFTLDLYDPGRGAKAKSLPLGPAAALELAGVNSKLALLHGPRRLVLVRLSDGKLVSLPLSAAAAKGLVDARLTAAGLFYASNLPRAAAKGRIVFESTAKLLARF